MRRVNNRREIGKESKKVRDGLKSRYGQRKRWRKEEQRWRMEKTATRGGNSFVSEALLTTVEHLVHGEGLQEV